MSKEALELLGGKIQQACPDWQTNTNAQDAFEVIRKAKAKLEQADKLAEAVKDYKKFLPISTAKDGGAASYSEAVRCCDNLKQALAEWEGKSDDQ